MSTYIVELQFDEITGTEQSEAGILKNVGEEHLIYPFNNFYFQRDN